MECNAIILAGGKSSRMGTDKGLITIGEKSMIEYILNELAASEIKDIIIVSNNLEYKKFGLPVYPDIIKDKGPLGGIYTGLIKSSRLRNVVLSCDIPLISSKVINHLIDNSADFPVLVSKYEDKIHPLIGIWDASLIPSIGENLIKDRLRLKDYLNENGAVYTDLKECGIILENTTLMNVNTPDELKRLKNGM